MSPDRVLLPHCSSTSFQRPASEPFPIPRIASSAKPHKDEHLRQTNAPDSSDHLQSSSCRPILFPRQSVHRGRPILRRHVDRLLSLLAVHGPRAGSVFTVPLGNCLQIGLHLLRLSVQFRVWGGDSRSFYWGADHPPGDASAPAGYCEVATFSDSRGDTREYSPERAAGELQRERTVGTFWELARLGSFDRLTLRSEHLGL